MMVAAGGIPGIWTLFWILWCLVSARTAAMAFNRWADWDYTTSSTRATMRRSELGTRNSTLALCVAALIAFVIGCAQLNVLCLALCPVACAMIPRLLAYETLHRLLARVPGPRARRRADGRVGRDDRLAHLATAVAAGRGRLVLGLRLRSHLRHAGRRLRPPGPAPFLPPPATACPPRCD